MARLRIFPFSESSWKQEEKLLANQKQLDKPKEIKKRKQILAKGKKRLKEDEQKNNPPKLKLAPIRENMRENQNPNQEILLWRNQGKNELVWKMHLIWKQAYETIHPFTNVLKP